MEKQNWIALVLLIFGVIIFCGCEKTNVLKENVEVTFLACHEADAILIQYHNHTILIDTGEDSCQEEVLSYLKAKKIKQIDILILTHSDKDHIGNAISIMENWNIKKIYTSSYKKNSVLEKKLYDYIKEKQIPYEEITNSKKIKIEEIELDIYPPFQSYNSSNNSSLVTIMKAEEVRTFFGADIKRKRIEELLKMDLQKVSLVKLPYHGRYISNLEMLLEKLDPEFIIVTADQLEEKTKKVLEAKNWNYECNHKNIVVEIDGKTWKKKEF